MTLRTEDGISYAFDLRKDRHDRANRNAAARLNAKRSELPEFRMEATTEMVRLFVPGEATNFFRVMGVLVS